MNRRGAGSGAEGCGHTPGVIVRAWDGQGFHARCLVCGTTGPERPTSSEALDALLPGRRAGGTEKREGEGGKPPASRDSSAPEGILPACGSSSRAAARSGAGEVVLA